MLQETKGKERKKIIKRIKHKMRLVVINDETLEERFSFRLSPLNIFTWGGAGLILFTLGIVWLIAFTSLRELIPGYLDFKTRRQAAYAAIKADSLQMRLDAYKFYVDRLRLVLSDSLSSDSGGPISNFRKFETGSDLKTRSAGDSLFRQQVEQEEKFNLQATEGQVRGPGNLLLFAPLQGVVSSEFDAEIKHYGMDIIAPSSDEAVKSVFNGTVIQASWTIDEGYVLYVQHPHDLVSVYKHNSVLLKKAGDMVKTGEALAIVGNTGELTTGPHLHFELWFKGMAVNPRTYINFR
jgi:murein DD-endopeptidase MepM/ murein hydrolase activator NlpD